VAPPRTLLRSRAIRADLPQSPATDRDEEKLLKGRYFEADCLATDMVDDFVSMTGASVGGFRQVARVSLTSVPLIPAVGIITSKLSPTRCFVQAFGEVVITGLTPGDTQWIGLDGRLSPIPPSRIIGKLTMVQMAGIALDTNVLLLRIDPSPIKLRG